MHKRTGFVAVVESGSCSMDIDGELGHRWEELATCGHLHRSRAAAERCGERLRAYNPKTRECSALWAFPRIHDGSGHRV